MMMMIGLWDHPVLCSHRVLRNEFILAGIYCSVQNFTDRAVSSLGDTEGESLAFPLVA